MTERQNPPQLDLFDRAWSNPKIFLNVSALHQDLIAIARSHPLDVYEQLALRTAASLLATIKSLLGEDDRRTQGAAQREDRDEYLAEVEENGIKSMLYSARCTIGPLIPALTKGRDNTDVILEVIEKKALLFLSLALARLQRPPTPTPELTTAPIEEKLYDVLNGRER